MSVVCVFACGVSVIARNSESWKTLLRASEVGPLYKARETSHNYKTRLGAPLVAR